MKAFIANRHLAELQSLRCQNSTSNLAVNYRIPIVTTTPNIFGAVRKEKMAGAIADFSAFSFHAVKNFTTAEG